MKKKLGIFAISCLAIIGLFLLIGFNLSDNSSSKRSDFPVLEPSPLMVITYEPTIKEQLDYADLIVEATVLDVSPIEDMLYVPLPGTEEAKIFKEEGSPEIRVTCKKVELQVDDYIKGNAGKKITMPIVSINLDSAPDFKVGDRFVLELIKYSGGGYTNASPVSSYFFIAHDNKVYPAGNDSETARFSGMDLSDFKKELRKIINM